MSDKDPPRPGGDEILLATLAEIGLPNRLVTAATLSGIMLVGDFIRRDRAALRRVSGMGPKSLDAAEARLAELGLSLGADLPGWDDGLAYRNRRALDPARIRERVFRRSTPPAAGERGTLEEELADLLGELPDRRSAELMALHRGFDAEGPRPVEALVQRFGLTRVRVRQILREADRRLAIVWRPLHRLADAKALMESGLPHPFSAAEFAAAAKEEGLTKTGFHAGGVLQALELAGWRHAIETAAHGGAAIYGRGPELALAGRLARRLREDTGSSGCTHLGRLAMESGLDADEIRRIASLFPETAWLDGERTWLMSSAVNRSRNRLARSAGKILSVAPGIGIDDLRMALLQAQRFDFVPPAGALARLLGAAGLAGVRDGAVRPEPGAKLPVIAANERIVVEELRSLGSPLARTDLETRCVGGRGMKAGVFAVVVGQSPLVWEPAPGVLALVGERVDPERAGGAGPTRGGRRSGAATGWSRAGAFWWRVRLSKAAAGSGSLPVASTVRIRVEGDWSLRLGDGTECGTMRVHGRALTGLKPVFERLGAGRGACVQFDFFLANRVAYVRVVGEPAGEFDIDPEDVGKAPAPA